MRTDRGDLSALLQHRIVLALILAWATARAEVVSYNALSFPESELNAPWEQGGEIRARRWLSKGSFFHHLVQGPWPWPHGEQDFYSRTAQEFAGVSSWFLEWRAWNNGSTEAFVENGPSTIATAGGGSWYHFTFASNQLRFFRPQSGFLYFDLEPEVQHTYRLEIHGTMFFNLFIDNELMIVGLPDGPYPNSESRVVWGSRFRVQEHTSKWSYIRYGGPIPEPGSGDFDSDGNIDLADLYLFSDYTGGPNVPLARGWDCGDIEPVGGDGDIDLADFAAFQNAFTGSE